MSLDSPKLARVIEHLRAAADEVAEQCSRDAERAATHPTWRSTQMESTAVKLPSAPPPKLFSEPLEIEGHVVAYRWSSHKMMGFEGIYTDAMVVRVDKVLKGEAPDKYIRVDFWGNVYPEFDLQLPEAVFTGQNPWRMVLNRPSAVFPRQPELCQSLPKDTVTMFYEDTGKPEEVSAFRNTTDTSEQYPPVGDLPCFVVGTNGVAAVH